MAKITNFKPISHIKYGLFFLVFLTQNNITFDRIKKCALGVKNRIYF